MLSSRDAQVIRAGIANLIGHGTIPPRILSNPDSSSYFFDARSDLGVQFYLGVHGELERWATGFRAKAGSDDHFQTPRWWLEVTGMILGRAFLKPYVKQKTEACERLQYPEHPKKYSCI